MTEITSIVRENVSVVQYKLNLAGDSLNAAGSNTSALNLLTDAEGLVDATLELMVPETRYPRARRIFGTALSIIADYKAVYFANEVSTAVSVVDPGSSVVSIPASITGGAVSVAPVSVTIPPLVTNGVSRSDVAGVLQLVKLAQVTHTAVSNGSWNSASMWKPAAVPSTGARVYISAARNVRYTMNSAVSLKTIRIDGVLSVARNQNTKLVIDTIVITSAGKFTINTSNAYTTSIEFAGGNINVAWDTRLISRGLLALGDVSVTGKFRTPFKGARDNIAQNVKKLTLTSAPTGWAAGDKIMITPVRMNASWVSYAVSENLASTSAHSGQTKLYTVSTINNSVSVNLTTSVLYNHRMPTNTSNSHTDRFIRTPYVANMTRNVVFRTRTPVSVHQRAHAIFMHGHVHLRNSKFKNMGRTNKHKTVVDIDAVISNVNTPVSARLNIRGRYPIHGHHLGLHGAHAVATFEYNVVSGTDGWGIAHHNSWMNINHNIVYEFKGAGIVAEVGSERGKWNNNLVCKSTSRFRTGTKIFSGQDIFKQGQAYAFTARALSVSGNVAAGFTNAAFAYLHRTPNLLESKASVLQIPEWTRYNASIPPDDIPIKNFNRNYGFVGKSGIEVIKENPYQLHSSRSIFKNSTFFEILHGFSMQYTYGYTIKNCEFIGKFAPTSKQQKNECITITNSADAVVVSTKIRDFKSAYDFNKRTVGSPTTDFWDSANNELMVIEESVVSISGTKIVGTHAAATTFKRASTLSPAAVLSVVYSTTTTNYPVVTDTSPTNYKIKGTFIDTTGNRKYPVALKQQGQAQYFARDGQNMNNFLKNVAANHGYYVVSTHKYLVFRDIFQDRANETSAWRPLFIRINETPASIWGVSSKLLGTHTLKSQVSVPRWTGRSPHVL